jgi:hypothetical protein
MALPLITYFDVSLACQHRGNPGWSIQWYPGRGLYQVRLQFTRENVSSSFSDHRCNNVLYIISVKPLSSTLFSRPYVRVFTGRHLQNDRQHPEACYVISLQLSCGLCGQQPIRTLIHPLSRMYVLRPCLALVVRGQPYKISGPTLSIPFFNLHDLRRRE